jgi:hypothetical protein
VQRDQGGVLTGPRNALQVMFCNEKEYFFLLTKNPGASLSESDCIIIGSIQKTI